MMCRLIVARDRCVPGVGLPGRCSRCPTVNMHVPVGLARACSSTSASDTHIVYDIIDGLAYSASDLRCIDPSIMLSSVKQTSENQSVFLTWFARVYRDMRNVGSNSTRSIVNLLITY